MTEATIRTRDQVREQYGDLLTGAPNQAAIEDLIDGEIAFDEIFAAAGEPPACPSWCAYEPWHRYDSIDSDLGAAFRNHVTNDGGLAVVIQEEWNKGGDVTLGPIQIRIHGNEHEGEAVDGDEIRRQAREMLHMADRYDEILAAEQS
jgi:hypothetical protein